VQVRFLPADDRGTIQPLGSPSMWRTEMGF
jgi:hypothetical protein